MSKKAKSLPLLRGPACPYCDGPTSKFGKMWTCAPCRVMKNDVDTMTWGNEIQRLPQVLGKGLLLVRKEQPE